MMPLKSARPTTDRWIGGRGKESQIMEKQILSMAATYDGEDRQEVLLCQPCLGRWLSVTPLGEHEDVRPADTELPCEECKS